MQPVYLFGILEFCNSNFNHSLFEIRYKQFIRWPLAFIFTKIFCIDTAQYIHSVKLLPTKDFIN